MTDSEGGRIELRSDEVKFATNAKALAGADIVLDSLDEFPNWLTTIS